MQGRLAFHPTLAQTVFPQTHLLRDALLIVGFSLFTGLSAQVSAPLPFTDVPISGQTFAVLLTGLILGSKRGALAMLAYLAEGLAGLPVFAGGTSAWSPTRIGAPVIIGPTAGFLFGFPIVAFVVGWFAERGWDRDWKLCLAAMALGNLVLYVPGLLWLARYVGAEKAIPLGLLPFIPGDAIKVLLAAAALPSAWAVTRRRNR